MFVIGAPGSGKSSVTEALARHFGYDQFLSGQAFRAAALSHPDTRTREQIAGRMAASPPMPIPVCCEVIAHSVSHGGRQGLVVDGFPRSVEQCRAIPVVLEAVRHHMPGNLP